jgi:hypothetical protein
VILFKDKTEFLQSIIVLLSFPIKVMFEILRMVSCKTEINEPLLLKIRLSDVLLKIKFVFYSKNIIQPNKTKFLNTNKDKELLFIITKFLLS